MSKKRTIVDSIQIHEHTSFNFAFIESVNLVAMALIQTGFYAKVTHNDNGTFKLTIYTDREVINE